MKNTENQNWEDHWKKELTNHTSPTTADDWSGMKHLLETQTTNRMQKGIVDPNLTREPKELLGEVLKSWPQNLLVFLLIGGLGFGLNQCRADDVAGEVDRIIKEERHNHSPGTDHIEPEKMSAPKYLFDTIYHTDDLGNLSTEIARIDSMIVPGI
jgi:hypothetical protein